MFDFLIKYPISIFEIREFLAAALNCPFDKILVVSSEENADLEIAAEELDKLCCLCIGTQIAITDAVSNIAAALTGGNVGGIMQTVTQQLGLGLMLSTLLITVPPMAGMWFNGMMATYSGYNAMQGWGTGQPATPPGMNNQQQVNYAAQNRIESPTNNVNNSNHNVSWTTGGSQTGATTTDTMKLTNLSGKENTPS